MAVYIHLEVGPVVLLGMVISSDSKYNLPNEDNDALCFAQLIVHYLYREFPMKVMEFGETSPFSAFINSLFLHHISNCINYFLPPKILLVFGFIR